MSQAEAPAGGFVFSPFIAAERRFVHTPWITYALGGIHAVGGV